MKVAIVGAGMTGCMLANMLKAESGIEVTVFEKSRGCGGRASTKSLDWGTFDLGAAIIPAKNPTFVDFMQGLVEQNIALKWPETLYSNTDTGFCQFPSERQHYVFKHKMNAACRHWVSDVELRTQCLITQMRYVKGSGWQVRLQESWLDEWFDKIVVTCPWPQTQALLDIDGLDWDFSRYQQSWTSCWAVALKVDTLVSSEVDFAYLKNHSMQTLVRDSAKPERLTMLEHANPDKYEIWVGHLGNALSDKLGKSGKDIATQLVIQELCSLLGVSESLVSNTYAHYWRYARPRSKQLPLGVVCQPSLGIWAAGDWSYGASIESAFQGASAVYQELRTREAR